MQNLYRADLGLRTGSRESLAKGISAGAIGGLAGTILMDLFGLVVLLVNGGPDTISFSLIGDAAATFASRFGITIPGGTPLGLLLHYLIGVLIGAAFGAGVCLVGVRSLSRRRGIVSGILFVEAMSIPMLTAAAIVLQMSTSRTAVYFATSFTMHLVFGGVIGWVVSYAFRPGRAATVQKRSWTER